MTRTLIDECRDGNIDEVTDMIRKGANIEITCRAGRTPLHAASIKKVT